MKSLTEEEVLAEVSIPIETKVTPYHNLSYSEQIDKKFQWLKGTEVLTGFSTNLENEIEKGKEFSPDWFRD